MKNTSKVILLILGCIIAVGAILLFAKTRVSPPTEIEYVDNFPNVLSQHCLEIDTVSGFDNSRLSYLALSDKINRFLLEEKISTDVADLNRKHIAEIYGNRLVDKCYNILRGNIWPETDIKEATELMEELSNARLSNDSPAATPLFFSNVENFNKTIRNYRDALALNRKAYYSPSNTTYGDDIIKQAQKYKNMQYLSNNTNLVAVLNKIPGKVADSHYAHIQRLISNLSNYVYNYEDKDDFLSAYESIQAEIDKYIKKASVYGISNMKDSDGNNIRLQSGKIRQEGLNYFRNKNSEYTPW